jgi:hypothetical protein
MEIAICKGNGGGNGSGEQKTTVCEKTMAVNEIILESALKLMKSGK